MPSRRNSPPGGRLPPLNQEYTESETVYEDANALRLAQLKKGFTVEQANEQTWSNQYDYVQHVAPPVQQSSALMNAESANKPKFLCDLETFLIKELNALGVANEDANETRLQAHREVFQYLIEDFKSYKPLLAAIKNEYEMMLRHQTDYIKQLEPLEQMLTTVTEQADKKIMRLRDEEKEEVLRVKKRNEELQTQIDSIRNKQFSLHTQVERLNDRLAEQYDRYRSEADARKLLVSDINDLKAQQEELLYQQQQASSKDKSEDPVVIRQELKTTREKEKSATQQINDILANYGDVIPKQDFINLQTKFTKITELIQVKNQEYDSLKSEFETLNETHKQMVRTRDEYYQESERLRRTATPRPEWKRCGNYITGGASKWQELSEGKSSDELVGMLLVEIAGAASDANSGDYLDTLGMGDEVPVHLKYAGEVKNRKLSKRDTTVLIKDVWKEKDLFDTKKGFVEGQRTPMSEYFILYLKEHFTNEKMAYEWSYNIANACQRYIQDDKIKLFYGVLCNEIDQELYFVQLQYIVSLLRILTKASEGTDPPGFFSADQFRDILRQFLDYQISEDDLEKLVLAAKAELDDTESADIEYTRLFFEDDEGKFGPFVDELKKHFEAIRLKYIDGIINLLQQKGEQATPTDLETAIYQNDNELPSTKIESLLLACFKCSTRAELESAQAIPLEEIRECLLTKHIKKYIAK